jgi:hypothetical protein
MSQRQYQFPNRDSTFSPNIFHEFPRNRFEDEYKAVIARATALGYQLPSLGVQWLQNNYLRSLKDAGIWDSLDVLYVFINDGSPQFSQINWKTPASFEASQRAGGSLAGAPSIVQWDPNKGFKGNIVGQKWLDTNWNLISNTVNYTLNNCGVGGYFSEMQVDASAQSAFACGDGSFQMTSIYPFGRNNTNTLNATTNDADSAITGPPLTGSYTSAMFHTSRSNTTTMLLYVDGVLRDSASRSPVAVPNRSVTILAEKFSVSTFNFSAMRCGMFYGGGPLVGKEMDMSTLWYRFKNSL